VGTEVLVFENGALLHRRRFYTREAHGAVGTESACRGSNAGTRIDYVSRRWTQFN